VTYLLDTHVLLWALQDDPRLSRRIREILLKGQDRLLWSAASTWELSIKASLGRIRFAKPLSEYLPMKLAAEGIETLHISSDHAARTETLPLHHRDPFDRLLVAQAQLEDATLITSDVRMREYEIEIAW
jgi:PIN domain nuclease of toxin-antitoxin system